MNMKNYYLYIDDMDKHYIKLWESVIHQAMSDCLNSDPAIRKEVREWLHTDDFYKVIQYTHYDSDYVIDIITKGLNLMEEK